jgi:hypothetical protein
MNRHVIATVLCTLCLLPLGAAAQQGQERPRWQQLSPAERDRVRQDRTERRDTRDTGQERRGMSRDERQQLRRDIGDHGRDIYGGQQGGFRPGQGRPQRR